MIHYSYFNDFGSFEAFALPYFRERTFEGADDRLSGGIIVTSDTALYESPSEQTELDLAARYSNTIGNWGLGLSWFRGTSRESDFFRFSDFTNGSTTVYYPQIDQLGVDVQLTSGGWLFKLEAIHRNFDDHFYQDFVAATFGTEYTLVGIFHSIYDLGLLSKYSCDQRDQNASSIFQNDAFIGARLSFNDISDSQLLLGIFNDLNNTDSRAVFLEASTRIAPLLTMNIELRYFDSSTPIDLLLALRMTALFRLELNTSLIEAVQHEPTFINHLLCESLNTK